jgi:uncharacterized protein YyaL (SSP411 family)
MERESFENEQIAEVLNDSFVSIKVDREERPDIDSVYMEVCQSMTGSGGWPLTVFMTPDQRPFFAGTYFPPHTRYGQFGMLELLSAVRDKWAGDRGSLTRSADEIMEAIRENRRDDSPAKNQETAESLPQRCVENLRAAFDREYGGFGNAPKFPSPHILSFLMAYYQKFHGRAAYSGPDPEEALRMAETTLERMYRGGIFDHIGFGFSRYSTDRQWLAPHFEKMLYDNALLLSAYTQAYALTGRALYKDVVDKTFAYIIREMTHEDGGFYCAQDADSEGGEGLYYLFTPDETLRALGQKAGARFNAAYDITEKGNFEGKSIPNLLHGGAPEAEMAPYWPVLREYRAKRASLHKDDKILTSWNGLMIAALAEAYAVFGGEAFLTAAERAARFIETYLSSGNTLYGSFRLGRRSDTAFLDDYAFTIMAFLKLYSATLEQCYLDRAAALCETCVQNFHDAEAGGFFLYGADAETLISRPKEIYDGAIPSGNSVMTWNLLTLARLRQSDAFETLADQQISFMADRAAMYPTGYGFFMTALLLRFFPPKEVICILKDDRDLEIIKPRLPKDAFVTVLRAADAADAYPLLNDQTTFYVCENNQCGLPANQLPF